MKTNESAAAISYFKKFTSTTPFMAVVLEFIYNLIKSFDLKEITQKIREEKASKKDLPAVTFSGTFLKRCIAGLKDWSSYICMDVDDLDFAPTLKDRISKDTFLNAVLQFISPRGRGLKIVVRVIDGVKENHELYFQAIAHYLKGAYGIEIDFSGSDWSRLCWLCHDKDVYYNPDGFVTSEALLRLLPAPADAPLPPLGGSGRSATATATARKTTASARNLPPAGPSDSTGDRPSDKLNRMPEIHAMAVRATERIGWQQTSQDLWTRNGKDPKDGCSAKWNIYDKEGIFIMTVFTSNGFPFKAHKGYTDVQIICLLEYNDDWTACITDLASRFLEPV